MIRFFVDDATAAAGAVVEQVGELQGERLCFRKISGAGPETGWVSIRVKDKQLRWH